MQTSNDVFVLSINKIKEPEKCRVIILNNDVSTIDTVFLILTEIFRKTAKQAENIANTANNTGRALVGFYTKEMAKTLIGLAGNVDKALQFEIEEDA